MKKIIAVVMAIMMALMMTACGSSKKETATVKVLDIQLSQEEYDDILNALSAYQMFPKDFLSQISEMDVPQIFSDSVGKILAAEPALRDTLFRYILGIMLSDRKFSDNELELVYSVGTNMFGYSEREIAGLLGGMIQTSFSPDIDALC